MLNQTDNEVILLASIVGEGWYRKRSVSLWRARRFNVFHLRRLAHVRLYTIGGL